MAQTAVGDLVVNLDVNSSKFNEQMEYVKRQFKQTGDAANDSALKVQQSFTRQESAAKKAGISVGQYNAAMRMLPAQFTDIAAKIADDARHTAVKTKGGKDHRNGGQGQALLNRQRQQIDLMNMRHQ